MPIDSSPFRPLPELPEAPDDGIPWWGLFGLALSIATVLLLGVFIVALGRHDKHLAAAPSGITPEQCTTLCAGAVVAWAPDSCVCDVHPTEIVWGAL